MRNGMGYRFFCTSGVSMNPGFTIVTLTPRCMSSMRVASSHACIAAFDAEYIDAPGSPRCPASDAMPAM